MKFWTTQETNQWLQSNGFPPDGYRSDGPEWNEEYFKSPLLSIEQAYFSRDLIDRFQPFKGAILTLSERTLCDNDESPIIIERFRLSYGETRSLEDVPTFVFDEHEKEECIAIVRLFIMFCWDGYLLSAGLNHLVHLWGHEGEGSISSRE